MDEMLDELIELDSCTMDLDRDDDKDELKYMQEKTTFEYIPEWCHSEFQLFFSHFLLIVVKSGVLGACGLCTAFDDFYLNF